MYKHPTNYTNGGGGTGLSIESIQDITPNNLYSGESIRAISSDNRIISAANSNKIVIFRDLRGNLINAVDISQYGYTYMSFANDNNGNVYVSRKYNSTNQTYSVCKINSNYQVVQLNNLTYNNCSLIIGEESATYFNKNENVIYKFTTSSYHKYDYSSGTYSEVNYTIPSVSGVWTGIKDGNYIYLLCRNSSNNVLLFKINILDNSCTRYGIQGTYSSKVGGLNSPTFVKLSDGNMYLYSYYNRTDGGNESILGSTDKLVDIIRVPMKTSIPNTAIIDGTKYRDLYFSTNEKGGGFLYHYNNKIYVLTASANNSNHSHLRELTDDGLKDLFMINMTNVMNNPTSMSPRRCVNGKYMIIYNWTLITLKD